MANEDNRFKLIYNQTSKMKISVMEIWLDTEIISFVTLPTAAA